MNCFRVRISNPWAFVSPKDQPEPESEHSTRESAEARCREIVVEELERRFAESGSWTEALQGYLDSRRGVVVESEGKTVASFDDFARAWVAERLSEDWSGLLKRIVHAVPEVPRGWFRWLHHAFPSRRFHAAPILGLAEEWRALSRQVLLDPTRMDGRLLGKVEVHAWEIGSLGLRGLAEACWGRLSRHAKGSMLAGLSNQDDQREWILARLSEAELGPEGVLEIACKAVWESDYRLFRAVMEKDRTILCCEVERLEPFEDGPSRESRYAGEVARLSNRVVDMALEACVLRGWARGARLALRLGADADLRIWVLQRNFSEHHSALSFSIQKENREIIKALFDAGAQAAKEVNGKSLYFAITTRQDHVAKRVLAAGLGFEPGDPPDWLASSRPGDNIEWERAVYFNCHDDDIDRARRLGAGLPLVHASEATWFYCGDGQGGRYRTLVGHFLSRDEVVRLRRYVRLGLPLKLTVPDFAILLRQGAYECLCWMIREWKASPAVMWRIRRELPTFGTESRLWRVQPDAKRVGILPDFDPGDQVPLELPDGGRLWVDVASIAGEDDQPGPVTPGKIWVRRYRVDARRRADRVVLRDVIPTWEQHPEPVDDYRLRELLPVVKEVDGVFLVTGMTMDCVRWADYPVGGDAKDWIGQWTTGAAWERLKPSVIARLSAQRTGHRTAPMPTLPKEELEPFPCVFHPWLRRGEDGRIGIDESAAREFPKVIADYRAWEVAERRREREWSPDQRFEAWPSWHKVPMDLRPWFEWNTLFQRPCPMSLRRGSAYEIAMCRRALRWWNERMIAGIRDAMS